jgi:hypothetical protein
MKVGHDPYAHIPKSRAMNLFPQNKKRSNTMRIRYPYPEMNTILTRSEKRSNSRKSLVEKHAEQADFKNNGLLLDEFAPSKKMNRHSTVVLALHKQSSHGRLDSASQSRSSFDDAALAK